MSRAQQKIIITAKPEADGAFSLHMEHWPAIPASEEDFAKLSADKQNMMGIMHYVGNKVKEILSDVVEGRIDEGKDPEVVSGTEPGAMA